MIRISFFPRPHREEPGKPAQADKPARRPVFRHYLLTALFSGLLGFALARNLGQLPEALFVERTFRDWLATTNHIPDLPAIPITLVEIDDPAGWTMLDVTLFLKSLPTENTPVTVIENLPAGGHPAWLRSFEELALRQPRLLLPIRLSRDDPADNASYDWLESGAARPSRHRGERYLSVSQSPGELLLGVVSVGVSNLASETQADTVPLIFWFNDRPVPSLALRAALLARKISVEAIRWKATLLIGARPVATNRDGSFSVDFSFLPGIKRLAASDFLLRLADRNSPAVTSIPDQSLQGVLILGDSSSKKFKNASGESFSRVEVLAAALATLLNGPRLRPLSGVGGIVLFGALVLLPWFLLGKNRALRFIALAGALVVYLLLAIHLAGSFGVALPLVVPLAILLSGAMASALLSVFLRKKS